MSKKTVIFYFSQSGNSLYTAKKIAAALGNATLLSIPEAKYREQYNYIDYEKVGFVIPLYFMGMPNMVKEFISKIEIPEGSYVFSVITRALTKGRILYDIDKMLISKGAKVNYGVYLTFPDSYIKWAEGPDEKKLNRLLSLAEESTNKIAERIVHEDNYREREGFILKNTSLLVYNVWKSRLKTMGKSFKAGSSCIGCGICERTCPAKNIRMENGKPVWSNKCEDCMACVQHCPYKAIYFNSGTINKRRYIHPDIKVNELLNDK